MSGTFSEIRTGHFHSGIDFRTQGVEGKPVYAAADGCVARIRIQPGGFGKAIYLEHPNGYTTVYAHLRNFIPRIQQYVKTEQYRCESFEVDLNPGKEKFCFKKGDLIAWSGNSGSSGGPHLHFETRETSSQNPINPKLFGLQITDNIPPVIQALKIYPADEYASINNAPVDLLFNAAKVNGFFQINENRPVKISGKVAFGIQAYDTHNASELKNGIVSIKIFVDEVLVFAYRVDEFAFAETRYVNAVIDYEELMKSKRRFIQTRILPNNPLRIYPAIRDKGIFSFNENKEYKVKVEVSDYPGNKCTLKFTVAGKPPLPIPLVQNDLGNSTRFRYDKLNRYNSKKLNLEIPADALYDDIWFTYAEEGPTNETLAKLYHVHSQLTPVQSNFKISIAPENLPQELAGKAVIVRLDENFEWISEGGTYKDGLIIATSRNFGVFSVMADTVAPKISPVNIHKGKNISGQKTISIKISDELSGIKSYRATMDGNWILMDYDPKNELLTYEIDDMTPKGNNLFLLVVEDHTGNRSEYKTALTR